MLQVTGYLHGQKRFYSILGLIFTFEEPKERDKQAVKEKVFLVFDELPEMGNEKISEDEEIEEVAGSEAKGVGFYYIRVLVNNKEYLKTSHIRFGFLAKTIGVLRNWL